MAINLPLTKPAREKMENLDNWRTCSPDHPPCAICKMPILYHAPLRMFDNSRNLEIAFHLECALENSHHVDSIDPESEFELDEIYCLYCEFLVSCNHIHEDFKKSPLKMKKQLEIAQRLIFDAGRKDESN